MLPPPFDALQRGLRLAAHWLDALWPRACAGCGGGLPGEVVFCAPCEARLARIPRDACPHCQLHPAAAGGHCGKRPGRDPLDASLAALWLEEPLSKQIHAFKYPARGLRGLTPGPVAATLECVCRAAQRAPGPRPDLVVPVPLHPQRLRARGFNPAGVLARGVARALAAPFDPVALLRTRDTPTQTGLATAARRRNVAGSMRARRPAPPCVWLVDDVITTGATVREAARALRSAGARRVLAIAAARTPLRN